MKKIDYLKDYRSNAKIISKYNRERLLIWLHKWGWSNGEIIRELLNVKRKIEYQYLKSGIIEKIELGPGYNNVYILSRKAAPEARNLYESLMGIYGNFIEYKFYNSTNFPKSLYAHNLTAQKTALFFEEEDINFELSTEKEFSDKIGAGVRPDFIINNIYGLVWNEIELNGKYKEALIYQLYTRYLAARRGDFEKIKFHCATEGIQNNIKKILSLEKCQPAKRLPGGKIILEPGNWNPSFLSEFVSFEIINKKNKKGEEEDPMADL